MPCFTAPNIWIGWLARSQQYIVELLLTRTLVLVSIFVLRFSEEIIDAYIVNVGLQVVFNHANVSVRLGPLRYLIATPNFHHWRHSQDNEALHRDYAAHFAFLDYLFGTAVTADRIWRSWRLRARRFSASAVVSV